MMAFRLMLFLLGMLVPSSHGLVSFDPEDPRADTILGPVEAGTIKKYDVLFVLDASTSISVGRFDAMRSFIDEVMDTDVEKLGPDDAHVGLVMFSDGVAANIPLNTYHDIKAFKEAVANLSYTRGDSELGKALRFIRTKAFKPENGFRPSVPHVLIMLTDGWISDAPLAKEELKKLKKMGVHCLVAGIGEMLDKAGIKILVDKPDNVDLKEWKGLKDKVPEIQKPAQQQPQKIQRCKQEFKTNVIFVVDSSSSIGNENFVKLKEFLINVINAFKVIGKNGVKVGMVQYSSYRRTKLVFNLNAYSNHKGIASAINKLKYSRGSTRTGYAMRMAEKWLVSKDEKKVHNNFIVLTDGKATDNVQVAAEELHSNNHTVLAVGVGKTIDVKELMVIASEPKEVHVFHPGDFDKLKFYLKYVVDELCRPADVESKQQKEEKVAKAENGGSD